MAAKELYHEIKFTTWRLTIDDDAKEARLHGWSER